MALDVEQYCSLCEHQDDSDDNVRIYLSVYQRVLLPGCFDKSFHVTEL